MRKLFSSIIICFIFTVSSISQNVTIYIVDREDYQFERVQKKIVSQEETGLDYRQVVLVYDNNKKEVIDGQGSYILKEPTREELKEIVAKAIQNLYSGNSGIHSKEENPHINDNDPFNKILGLYWGMEIEDAVTKLKEIGVTSWTKAKDDDIICIKNITWDGVTFCSMKLGSMTSNKQKKYLSTISFGQICQTSEEAKSLRESIAVGLRIKYGASSVSEEIDSNKFKRYTVYQQGDVRISRINLCVNKIADGAYAVVLVYMGQLDAFKRVKRDNDGF